MLNRLHVSIQKTWLEVPVIEGTTFLVFSKDMALIDKDGSEQPPICFVGQILCCGWRGESNGVTAPYHLVYKLLDYGSVTIQRVVPPRGKTHMISDATVVALATRWMAASGRQWESNSEYRPYIDEAHLDSTIQF